MRKPNKTKKSNPDALNDKIDGPGASAVASGNTKGQFFETLKCVKQAQDTIKRIGPLLKLSDVEIALLEVFNNGSEVFQSEELFYSWLTTPCPALGGKIPLKMIISQKSKLIWDELIMIEYGVFA